MREAAHLFHVRAARDRGAALCSARAFVRVAWVDSRWTFTQLRRGLDAKWKRTLATGLDLDIIP